MKGQKIIDWADQHMSVAKGLAAALAKSRILAISRPKNICLFTCFSRNRSQAVFKKLENPGVKIDVLISAPKNIFIK